MYRLQRMGGGANRGSGFLNNSRGTWGLQLHSVDPASLARILQGLGFRAENSSAFRAFGSGFTLNPKPQTLNLNPKA